MSRSITADIGQRIAAYRRRAGLTATELAALVPRLTPNGLAKIENGHRAVLPVDLALEIAFALDVPPTVLLMPVGSPSSTVTLCDQEWLAADLLPWLVGPQIRSEREWEESSGAHASLVLETARTLVDLDRTLSDLEQSVVDLERTIENAVDSELLQSELHEAQRQYSARRSEVLNTRKLLGWINRQFPRTSKSLETDTREGSFDGDD